MPPPDLAHCRDAFGLTSSELRVLVGIVSYFRITGEALSRVDLVDFMDVQGVRDCRTTALVRKRLIRVSHTHARLLTPTDAAFRLLGVSERIERAA